MDYVFSDKTGTLTRNEMVFKYIMVGKEKYGANKGYKGILPETTNVDFKDERIWEY